MKRRFHPGWFVAALGAWSLSACNDSQEKAHATLAARQFDFSVDEFLRAAQSGKLDVVRDFLDAGMEVETADADGNTALLMAAENGHGHLVTELLTRKADPNHARSNGDTPLIVAARSGDTQSLSKLLEAGADPAAKNGRNLTALAEASLAGRTNAVSLLAGKSGHSLDYALQLAAVKGKTDIIAVLLNKGADVLSRSSENRTPLMYAALYGREEAVRYLTDRGSNRLAIDNDHKTAAMLAGENGHDAVASYLNDPETESAPEYSSKNPTPPEAPRALGAVIRTGSLVESPTPPEMPAQDAAPPKITAPLKLADARLPDVPGTGMSRLRGLLRLHDYRERQLPILVDDVRADGSSAGIQLLEGDNSLVSVSVGEVIPGTRLQVVEMRRRHIHCKGGKGELVNVSTVLVRDLDSGESVLAQKDRPAMSARTCALLKDPQTGQLYEVKSGDAFQIGNEAFLVTDVRPAQVVLEDKATKETMIIGR